MTWIAGGGGGTWAVTDMVTVTFKYMAALSLIYVGCLTVESFGCGFRSWDYICPGCVLYICRSNKRGVAGILGHWHCSTADGVNIINCDYIGGCGGRLITICVCIRFGSVSCAVAGGTVGIGNMIGVACCWLYSGNCNGGCGGECGGRLLAICVWVRIGRWCRAIGGETTGACCRPFDWVYI